MYVIDIIQEVVQATSAKMLTYLLSFNPKCQGVRFDFGHPSDISMRIAQMSATEENRLKKYPLIGLFLDTAEQIGENPAATSSATLSIFIAMATLQNYNPEQRKEISFKPVIHKIRDEFFLQLFKHNNVIKPVNGKFRYSYVDRYQWGKGGLQYYENGKANAFNDFIDAAEITNLEIQIKNYC